jgi:alpha-D-ribose 1-methylphosphonate 5-triphosphate synthase subunit PhnL
MIAMANSGLMVRLDGVAKPFTMHLRGGAALPVVRDVAFDVCAGECVVLGGPSGVGKSSILKMIYGNYRADAGEIWVRDDGEWVDVAAADARRMLRLRKNAVGYVSQFLRAIPRVAAIELVEAAAREGGLPGSAATDAAAHLLGAMNLPERLWRLPPATFSGGEQQRVNIARGLAAGHPVLLLDEPTASLDAASRDRVIELILARRDAGTAILGIFHDEAVRERVASRIVDVTRFAA